MIRNLLSAARSAACLLVLAGTAHAVCCPVVPPGTFLQASGQLNLVVRDGGVIRLVPNIRFAGDADDFALIVPTPALPQLAPVDDRIWTEAAQLTQPVFRRSSRVMDCGTTVAVQADSGPLQGMTGDVIVHAQETVGAFDATIVSSTDPTALVTWLTDNGYLPDASQVAAFAPLAADGWFFTAMKLHPGTPVPPGGWDTSVDPVELTYAGDEFVLPLDVLAINVAPSLALSVYVVDDHRDDLPGFTTAYSNHLSAGEMSAIQGRYPTLAPFLAAGRTLTRLDRRFQASELSGTLRLAPASTDDETRTIAQAPSIPGDVLLLAAPFLWFRRRRPPRPLREPSSGEIPPYRGRRSEP